MQLGSFVKDLGRNIYMAISDRFKFGDGFDFTDFCLQSINELVLTANFFDQSLDVFFLLLGSLIVLRCLGFDPPKCCFLFFQELDCLRSIVSGIVIVHQLANKLVQAVAAAFFVT